MDDEYRIGEMQKEFEHLKARVSGLEWAHIKGMVGTVVRFRTGDYFAGVQEGEVASVSAQGFMTVRTRAGKTYDVYPCQLVEE